MYSASRHSLAALFVFSAISSFTTTQVAQGRAGVRDEKASARAGDAPPGMILAADAAQMRGVPGRVIVKFRPDVADALDRHPDGRRAGAYLAGRMRLPDAVAPAHVEPVFAFPVPPGLTRSAAFARRVAKRGQAAGAGPAGREPAPALNAIYRLALPDGSSVEEACAAMRQSADVLWAEPERTYHTQRAPDDPYYSSSGSWGQSYADLWSLQATQPEPAWEQTQGEGVLVAVIDTGLDFAHEDLYRDTNENGQLDSGEQYNAWINPGEDLNHNGLADPADFNGVDDDHNGYVDDLRGWNFVSNGRDPTDDNGHGTHVAGTIAAVADNGRGIAGIAPRARIMAVKCLNAAGSGTSAQLAGGIFYAVDNGARVLNNSWGGSGTSRVISDAIAYARAHNVVVVAAAGNMATNAAFSIPAGTPGVLTVAALDANLSRASFSNFGSAVEVSAPGVDVLSLRAAGTDMYGDGKHFVPPGTAGARYYRSNGTSMACPLAAGLAALVIAREPALPEQAVRRAVAASAAPLADAGLYLGTGLIRCNEALAVAASTTAMTGELQTPDDREVRSAQAPLDVTGRIGAATYTLEIGAGYYPQAWTLLAAGEGPLEGVLATVSMTDRKGPYRLRLSLEENGRTGCEHAVFQADPALHPGWPASVGGGVFLFGDIVLGCSYTASMADVNGDGREEIFVSSGGFTFGLNGDGGLLPGWPARQSEYPAYLSNNDLPGPSIEDMDGDGVHEILWTLRDYYPDSPNSPWRAWCFNGRRPDGSKLGAFPQDAPDAGSNAFEVPFVLGDLDGDGILEAASVHTRGNNNYLYRLSAFTHQGTRLFTRDLPDSTESFVGLGFGDVDADGKRELVAVSAATAGNRSIYLHALGASGAEQTGYPRLLCTPLSSEYLAASPIFADLDGDADLEVVLPFGGSQSRIGFYHHDGAPLAGAGIMIGNYDTQLLNCALGDVDGDGRPEVVATANYRPIMQGFGSNRIYVARLSGALLPGWPFPLAEDPMSRPAIVDVDDDGRQDVCFTTNAGGGLNNGVLFAVSGTGAVIAGFPKPMSFGSTSGVSVGDVDGDGRFELITATMAGSIYAWDLPTPALASRADWPLPFVNRRNTNVFRDRAWPVVPGDLDTDGDVDAADLERFIGCKSGERVPLAVPGRCRGSDFDRDGDVDQSDFGLFQRCYSGADLPADPSCRG